ncbi:MAG: hypothetical protein RSB87_06375 [Clostridia bacterium]
MHKIKDKTFSSILQFVIIANLVMVIEYIIKTTSMDADYSSYSFWNYIGSNGSLSPFLMMLSTIYITLGSSYTFFSEINSGVYKNIISRIGYKKYILISFKNAAVKALCLLPLISILILFLGKLLYTDNIGYYTGDILTSFVKTPYDSPFVYALSSILLMCMYAIILVQLIFILVPKFKKIYILEIALFIIVNLYNFIFSNVIPGVMGIIFKTNIFNGINLFYGYHPGSLTKIFPMFIALAITLCITTCILFLQYKKKESLVLKCG